MIGIVVVSHSRPLAEAAVGLAGQMLQGDKPRIEVAAGLPDGSLGTDPTAVQAAIESVYGPDGVLVLADLGSAVLNAEMALDLLADDERSHVKLSAAPLVEGLVAAAVTAAGGADLDAVAREAAGGLAGKQEQVAPAEGDVETVPTPTSAHDATAARAEFTVVNAHGLHARPVAKLVETVQGFEADVQLRNVTTGAGPVTASSMGSLTTLEAAKGQTLEVSATGADAQAAVDAVVALAKNRFGDSPEKTDLGTAGAAPATAPAGKTSGPQPVSPGIAVGPAHQVAQVELTIPESEPGTPEEQHARLSEAIEATRSDITAKRAKVAKESGEKDAAIFDAHLVMLGDAAIMTGAKKAIDAGTGAAKAWNDSATKMADMMAGLTDEYMRARAIDVRSIRDQVLAHLLGVSAEDASGPGILVSADLTPTQAADLDPAVVKGIILAAGSPTAHAAILSRSKGIPMITGAGQDVLDVANGTTIAMDGSTGAVVIDPSPEVESEYQDRLTARERNQRAAREKAHDPAVTRDGATIPVVANVGSVKDAEAAAAAGADGAGLVRSEFLFQDRPTPPTQDEQYEVYHGIAEALGGQKIIIRTLDAGGDKPLAFLPMAHEENPFLGIRGLRLSLQRKDLLLDQLAAIIRVAEEYPVGVMFPMVSTVDELLEAREVLAEAARSLGRGIPEQLQVGIMIEVPAAALKAATFVPYVDFFSVGTNDLTQYTLAAERGNPELAHLGDALDPGVLKLIGALCQAKGTATVSVCGESAADPLAAAVLLGLGVDKLSVSAPSIADTKQRVRSTHRDAARVLAARVLRMANATQVRSAAAQDSEAVPASAHLSA